MKNYMYYFTSELCCLHRDFFFTTLNYLRSIMDLFLEFSVSKIAILVYSHVIRSSISHFPFTRQLPYRIAYRSHSTIQLSFLIYFIYNMPINLVQVTFHLRLFRFSCQLTTFGCRQSRQSSTSINI